MTATIYRYEVPVDDEWHNFELYGDPLAVSCRQSGWVEFWARAYPHEPDVYPFVRRFRVFGTGHPLPSPDLRHWGVAFDGPLVWHLMEEPT
jgi:hypothetical protein